MAMDEYHEKFHDPRLDSGRAALIAQLDEALKEVARLKQQYEPPPADDPFARGGSG
jgi:hypothetical protein